MNQDYLDKIKIMNDNLENNNYYVKVIFYPNSLFIQRNVIMKGSKIKIIKCIPNNDFNIRIDNYNLSIDPYNNGWFYDGMKSIAAFNL